MRKVVAVLAAASTGLTMLIAAPTGASAGSGVGTVAWTPCTDFVGLECANLDVPLDHANPAGRQITLAITRKAHTAPEAQYKGVMLLNPGGPGIGGRDVRDWFPGSVAEDELTAYDLIGFAPRGVGASRPRMECGTDYDGPLRADYVPASAEQEHAWRVKARDFAHKCSQSFGWLLPYMKTTDLARDMDAIRAALGQDKISYIGYSYGTYLGAVYATLFPGRVNRMVLDSIVKPSAIWWQQTLNQDYALNVRIREFFGWAAAHHSVYHLGSDPYQVERKYYQIRKALKTAPIQGRIGPSELTDTFLAGGYTNQVWPQLAEGLSRFETGDPGYLADLYDAYAAVPDDGGHAAYLATSCTDTPTWPSRWATWRRDSKAYHAGYPFATWANTWFNAPCFDWDAPAGTPVTITGDGLPPILMIQAAKDAGTPYYFGLEIHSIMKSSRLVLEDGGNHGVSGSGNVCVDSYLADYLATGALPPAKPGPDATCAALPDPQPLTGSQLAAPAKPRIPLHG